ncbi:MAG: SDR family oxidoreductase [Nocardioides sp.]|nr:SDR family oxidoreductase [Nocardioides sp.]
MAAPLLLVLGAGPGVGLATADRFAREGYAVVLAARSPGKLDTEHETIRLDLTDEAQVREIVDAVGARFGQIDVIHFNPSVFRQKDPLELTVDELLDDLRLGVAPLLPAVQAARPHLREGARIVVTGSAAADRPWNKAASLGVQKAAVRNLVTSIDTTLAPDGIRAVAVQVNGVLAEEGPFSPAAVAEALYAASVRPDQGWTPHVDYDG